MEEWTPPRPREVTTPSAVLRARATATFADRDTSTASAMPVAGLRNLTVIDAEIEGDRTSLCWSLVTMMASDWESDFINRFVSCVLLPI